MAKNIKARVVTEPTRLSEGPYYYALELTFDDHPPVVFRMSDNQYSHLLAAIVGREPNQLLIDAHNHPAMGIWIQQVCDKINK